MSPNGLLSWSAMLHAFRALGGVAENIRVTLRMPAAPSNSALVVGDPLTDLTQASDEAVGVAQALAVAPLLGAAANIKAVREATRGKVLKVILVL